MSLVCGEIFDLAIRHFCDKVIQRVQSVCFIRFYCSIPLAQVLMFSAQNYNWTKTNCA